MKQFLLSVGLLFSAAINAQDCSDLFISEYVEGWSNNKAIEIYNPTDQVIDLSEYTLKRFSNGSSSAGTQYTLQLSGTIQPYDVFVAVLDKRNNPNGTGQDADVWDDLQAKADAFFCPDYDQNAVMYFNGNDALTLSKGNTLLDVFGKPGEDPDNGNCEGAVDNNAICGWTTELPFVAPNGVVATTDHSMIRKSSILTGQSTFNVTYFDPLNEWDTIPPVILDQNDNLVGNWESLGSHECDCNASSLESESVVNVAVYPNPSEDGTFNLSTNSKVVSVQVYNTVGKSVFLEESENGIQSISLGTSKGVYIMKIKIANGTFTSRRVVIN